MTADFDRSQFTEACRAGDLEAARGMLGLLMEQSAGTAVQEFALRQIRGAPGYADLPERRIAVLASFTPDLLGTPLALQEFIRGHRSTIAF